MKKWHFLILLAGLNAFDGVVTFLGLRIGAIDEQNPLMDALYQFHPLCFLVAKLIGSLILCWIAKRLSSLETLHPFLQFLLFGSLILYFVIFSMHVYWLIVYFG